MKKLEEEINFNSYLVNEKIPREMESKKTSVYFLQKLVAEPAMTQADLTALESEVRDQGHPDLCSVACSELPGLCSDLTPAHLPQKMFHSHSSLPSVVKAKVSQSLIANSLIRWF